jgi:molecular chaperone Hsp33
LNALFGEGYMAITLDHGMGKQPYQGIVELGGTTLTDCCLEYLHQSEQFKVHIKTHVAKNQGRGWQAGGVLVQRLPEDEHSQQIILPPPKEVAEIVPETSGEAWERTQIFVDSLTREEITSPELPPRDVLYRLFHDDGVWVYESSPLSVGCRCTRERIAAVLESLSVQERAELVVGGVITVNCQFCNKAEIF